MSKSFRSRLLMKSSLSAALALLATPAFAHVSVSDARVVEGNQGDAALVFEVTLSAPEVNAVSFRFETSDGTADAASFDFLDFDGDYSIPAGQTRLLISVPVEGDTAIEPNEYLVATISNIAGANLGRATGRGLIVNDDNKMLVTAPHDPRDQESGSFGNATGASAMSSDGRYVAFVTTAVDLIEIWPNAYPLTKRVWVRDNRTGVTTLASVGVGGADSNGDSTSPAISADGRYVVFESQATNLVAGDDNGGTDVFRRDLVNGTTELVSWNFAGTAPASGWSTKPSISANGRLVAFQSTAADVVANDGNTHADAFVRDMQADATEQVNPSEFQGAYAPRITPDGRYVVYDRGAMEPWRRDLQTGEQVRAIWGTGVTPPNSNAYNYGISADGRYVLFTSSASNLPVPDAGGNPGVYVSDLQAGTIVLASRGSNGLWVGNAGAPALSGDGRYVTFQTSMTAAGEPVDDGRVDVYLRDLQANTTARVSQNYLGGLHGGGDSESAAISPDGRVVSFLSNSPTMLPGDTNTRSDVFRVELPRDASLPVLTIEDALLSENNQWGQTELVFQVSLSGASSQDVTFEVETVDASASAGSDYVAAHDVPYLIPAGSTGTTVTIPLLDDSVFELSEVFDLYLGNLRGARTEDAHATGAIGDDDSNRPTLSIDDVRIDEGNAGTRAAIFTVRLSNTWHQDVSFDIATANGTATAGVDYEPLAMTGATIPVNSMTGTFSVAIVGDPTREAYETFLVDVSNISGGVVATDAQAVGTIVDDDSFEALSIGDVVVSEGTGGTKQASFTVTLSAPSASPVVFDIATADGSATAGSDYVASALVGQSIPAGTTSKVFTVTINGDGVVEPDETFLVNLANVTGATVADGQATGTITNDDAYPTISVGDLALSEGDSGTKLATFTLTLSAAAASPVGYGIATSNGTAIAGTDYVGRTLSGQTIPVGASSATFSVTINGDLLAEINESFFVTLANVSGATVVDGQAMGTIVNDDAFPTISIGDVTLSEGHNGTQVATFTLSLSKPADGMSVTYDIATANGTATAGSDYLARSLNTQSIPVGMSSAIFSVSVIGDTAIEPNETFLVNLTNVGGATVADGQAVGTITNDDVAPSLSVGDVSITEGNSGTKQATFTVQLSAPAASPVSYSFATANGTASAPGDYLALSGSGTIPAGVSSQAVTVTINGDTAVEGNETFLLNISGVSGATVVDGQATGTISNDDVLPTLSIGDVSIVEGNKSSVTATFTVSLSAAASGTVSFNLATANGTAVAPGDYTARTATAQSIPAGSLSKTFAVTVKSDKAVEPNEAFFVNVSNVAGNVTVADAQAIGTIVNDDGAALSVSRVNTGGLYDDVEDRRGDPVLSPDDYALLLLDSAQQVCARAGGASVVGIDGVENLSVLAELADTANRLCPRQPRYGAVLKANGLGFLVDGLATHGNAGGAQLLELSADAKTNSTATTLLAEGHARPLTVLLAATASADARERVARSRELDRLVRARLATDPRARIVVLGAGPLSSLVDLTARSLPAGAKAAERVWVSNAVLAEFEELHLDLPAAKPAQQVLQLQH